MLLTMSVLHVLVPRLPSSHLYMSETDQHHYNGPIAEAWHGQFQLLPHENADAESIAMVKPLILRGVTS